MLVNWLANGPADAKAMNFTPFNAIIDRKKMEREIGLSAYH